MDSIPETLPSPRPSRGRPADPVDYARQQVDGPSGEGNTATTPAGPGSRPTAVRALPADILPGYEIVREISRGGQGVVYQAIQKSTKRIVAIKVLLEGQFASKSTRRRFEREVELVAQLNHPSVIAIFDSGETPDGQAFYVMDYVRGLPLHRHVRESRLPLESALRLFIAVCDAVQFAHQHGIIHRDLKPSNILVDAKGLPKILDFGLAKSLSAGPETGVSMTQGWFGTLPYMSPEQAGGKSECVDARTDIYALGVILYELLTGRYPYPVTNNAAEALRHIHETEPTPPTRQWTRENGIGSSTRRRRRDRCPIDDELQTIVMKALEKDVNRRYQSGGELARDVGRYLAGEPIEAKRDSAWYVLRKLVRRHKATAAAAVVVALSTISTVIYFGYMWRVTVDAETKSRKAAQDAVQQARDFEQTALAARAEIRRQALGWFLLEWQADRTTSAKQIAESTPEAAPERAAMRFLMDTTFPEARFVAEFPADAEALMHFAIGERRLKAGNSAGAEAAFRESIHVRGGSWLRERAEARLAQLKNAPRESAGGVPPDATREGGP